MARSCIVNRCGNTIAQMTQLKTGCTLHGLQQSLAISCDQLFGVVGEDTLHSLAPGEIPAKVHLIHKSHSVTKINTRAVCR